MTLRVFFFFVKRKKIDKPLATLTKKKKDSDKQYHK